MSAQDRITIEALKFYVPLFHLGEEATQKLLTPELTPAELNRLETIHRLRDFAVERIASLARPLITKEINKLIVNSHLHGREDLFDLLYYAGINGMVKGLRHFQVEKLNASSTNYLFQWIVTYAKKELAVAEAPFGIPPSRFQRYKKISAVRKKLSAQIGYYASNEEVLAFFKSGKADLKTMNGRLKDAGKPSASNQNITLELIEEQEHFEQNLNYVNLLDPLDDYSADVKMSEHDAPAFHESLFGTFLELHSFTPEAIAVLISELKVSGAEERYEKLAKTLSDGEYKSLSLRWRDLLRDVHGPFYSFLKTIGTERFEEFDIPKTIKSIEAYDKPIAPARYAVLFAPKEAP
jgi:DNA-directed RNA polymerase specialized sigma subunit